MRERIGDLLRHAPSGLKALVVAIGGWALGNAAWDNLTTMPPSPMRDAVLILIWPIVIVVGGLVAIAWLRQPPAASPEPDAKARPPFIGFQNTNSEGTVYLDNVVHAGPQPNANEVALANAHAVGLRLLDDLRGVRKATVEPDTEGVLRQRFEEWDSSTSDWVRATHGHQFWGKFGGDNGLLAFPYDPDFPDWVLSLIQETDRRLLRLRWIERGKVGWM